MRWRGALGNGLVAFAFALASCDDPDQSQRADDESTDDAGDTGSVIVGADAAAPGDAGPGVSGQGQDAALVHASDGAVKDAGFDGADPAPADAGPPLATDAGHTLADGGCIADATMSCMDGDPSASRDVDLLFVIDNSGSMASEQKKLSQQLPRLVGVLTSGDRYYGTTAPPGTPPSAQFFPKLRSLHIGVVSSNMGGIDEFPANSLEAVLSCAGAGDDGKLLHDPSVALRETVESRGGRNPEFPGYEVGEVVVAADETCRGVLALPSYQEYVAGAGSTPEDVALRFRCVAQLGVRGCPFEQQLEAMWKAVSPSSGSGELYTFVNGAGHGDSINGGFLRADAMLAVVHVSDEDDCSIRAAGKVLFDLTAQSRESYGPINLRCGVHADDPALLWPASRYVAGLQSLKPNHPERIVFAAIVGIPEIAVGRPYDEILALPEMQFVEREPAGSGLPRASCEVANAAKPEEAYPARRFVEVAKGLGDRAVLHSICANDYAPAIESLIAKIVDPPSAP